MHTARILHQLVVRTISKRTSHGTLQWGNTSIPCAIGRSGRRVRKREGDGKTPSGIWPILSAFYRPDRLIHSQTSLSLRPLRPSDGWCDAPADRNYNRHVSHPYPASAERLWRSDGLYDIVVVLGHNLRPRIRGGGSAIFLHCARPDFGSTEGCIAVRRADLIRLLPRLGRQTRIVIP